MKDEIKNAIKKNKLIIGTENTLKSLKLGKLVKIFLSKNCPANIVNDIKHYAKLSATEVVQVDMGNDELGIVCKKPFLISVLSIEK